MTVRESESSWGGFWIPAFAGMKEANVKPQNIPLSCGSCSSWQVLFPALAYAPKWRLKYALLSRHFRSTRTNFSTSSWEIGAGMGLSAAGAMD